MSLLHRAHRWFRGRILRDRTAYWDAKYASGDWEKLKGPAETARLDATARLLRRHVPPGRVLEIGCGEALLQQHLQAGEYHNWLGVDISAIAIERAQAFAGADVRYVVADMETLEPGLGFDAIVFTESIYYAKDCAALLRRYRHFLSPAGIFLVSICRTKRSDRIWSDIHTVTAQFDLITTANEIGTWDCAALRPIPPG